MNLPQHKRVSFNEKCSVEFVEPPRTSLTPQERDTVWYSPAEMESFHSEARRVCRQQRIARQESNRLLESVASLRGLELRLSSRRQKRKYMTIQCVLMAQQKMHMKQEALARFAAKCTEWATKAAAVEGQRDFLLAYAADSVKDETLARYLPPLPAMTPFPVPLKGQQKRSCASEETSISARNVRQRTSVC